MFLSLPWRHGEMRCNKNQVSPQGRRIGAGAGRNARIEPYAELFALGLRHPSFCLCHGAAFLATKAPIQ